MKRQSDAYGGEGPWRILGDVGVLPPLTIVSTFTKKTETHPSPLLRSLACRANSTTPSKKSPSNLAERPRLTSASPSAPSLPLPPLLPDVFPPSTSPTAIFRKFCFRTKISSPMRCAPCWFMTPMRSAPVTRTRSTRRARPVVRKWPRDSFLGRG